MGLFDKLFGSQKDQPQGDQCSKCGAKTLNVLGRVSCTNPSCSNFLGGMFDTAASPSSQPPAGSTHSGSFAPKRPIAIRYTNFQGVTKEFTADATTAVRKKDHLVVQVVPTGERIVLARKKIANLAEVESSFPQPIAATQSWPTARERQVLNYHKKHKSTSPLYEQIRAKYPNW